MTWAWATNSQETVPRLCAFWALSLGWLDCQSQLQPCHSLARRAPAGWTWARDPDTPSPLRSGSDPVLVGRTLCSALFLLSPLPSARLLLLLVHHSALEAQLRSVFSRRPSPSFPGTLAGCKSLAGSLPAVPGPGCLGTGSPCQQEASLLQFTLWGQHRARHGAAGEAPKLVGRESGALRAGAGGQRIP